MWSKAGPLLEPGGAWVAGCEDEPANNDRALRFCKRAFSLFDFFVSRKSKSTTTQPLIAVPPELRNSEKPFVNTDRVEEEVTLLPLKHDTLNRQTPLENNLQQTEVLSNPISKNNPPVQKLSGDPSSNSFLNELTSSNQQRNAQLTLPITIGNSSMMINIPITIMPRDGIQESIFIHDILPPNTLQNTADPKLGSFRPQPFNWCRPNANIPEAPVASVSSYHIPVIFPEKLKQEVPSPSQLACVRQPLSVAWTVKAPDPFVRGGSTVNRTEFLVRPTSIWPVPQSFNVLTELRSSAETTTAAILSDGGSVKLGNVMDLSNSKPQSCGPKTAMNSQLESIMHDLLKKLQSPDKNGSPPTVTEWNQPYKAGFMNGGLKGKVRRDETQFVGTTSKSFDFVVDLGPLYLCNSGGFAGSHQRRRVVRMTEPLSLLIPIRDFLPSLKVYKLQNTVRT